MKVGLIGVGYWGTKILEELERHPKIDDIICIEEMDDDSLLIDYIISQENVTHVFIATPIDTHFYLTEMALLAGKHVMCEKMLTPELETTQHLVSLARKKSLQLLTDFTYAFNPALPKSIDDKYLWITMRQWGRFRDESVETVLGCHALAIGGTVTNIENARLVDQYTDAQFPHNTWISHYELTSGQMLKINVSITAEDKYRSLDTNKNCYDLDYPDGIKTMIDKFMGGGENTQLTLDVAKCLEAAKC